jgi:hypothetical protein
MFEVLIVQPYMNYLSHFILLLLDTFKPVRCYTRCAMAAHSCWSSRTVCLFFFCKTVMQLDKSCKPPRVAKYEAVQVAVWVSTCIVRILLF